jgi:hypothetical protein
MRFRGWILFEPVDDWEIGKAIYHCSDGKKIGWPWLRRCTMCGIPRGTVAHASMCMAGTCEDPDAFKPRAESGEKP